MKSILTYILILFSTISIAIAQPDYSKIKELKVAYFTEKLELTSSESVQFWKIYNQYEVERHTLKKSGRKPEGQKMSEMTDAQIYQWIDSSLEKKEKEAVLQKKYFAEFKKVLPAKKLVKLLNIEEQFRQFIFKQAQQKK